ncbi:hypothetical protein Agub_g11385, partial [Astrephomene gubernaculifera]
PSRAPPPPPPPPAASRPGCSHAATQTLSPPHHQEVQTEPPPPPALPSSSSSPTQQRPGTAASWLHTVGSDAPPASHTTMLPASAEHNPPGSYNNINNAVTSDTPALHPGGPSPRRVEALRRGAMATPAGAAAAAVGWQQAAVGESWQGSSSSAWQGAGAGAGAEQAQSLLTSWSSPPGGGMQGGGTAAAAVAAAGTVARGGAVAGGGGGGGGATGRVGAAFAGESSAALGAAGGTDLRAFAPPRREAPQQQQYEEGGGVGATSAAALLLPPPKLEFRSRVAASLFEELRWDIHKRAAAEPPASAAAVAFATAGRGLSGLAVGKGNGQYGGSSSSAKGVWRPGVVGAGGGAWDAGGGGSLFGAGAAAAPAGIAAGGGESYSHNPYSYPYNNNNTYNNSSDDAYYPSALPHMKRQRVSPLGERNALYLSGNNSSSSSIAPAAAVWHGASTSGGGAAEAGPWWDRAVVARAGAADALNTNPRLSRFAPPSLAAAQTEYHPPQPSGAGATAAMPWLQELGGSQMPLMTTGMNGANPAARGASSSSWLQGQEQRPYPGAPHLGPALSPEELFGSGDGRAEGFWATEGTRMSAGQAIGAEGNRVAEMRASGAVGAAAFEKKPGWGEAPGLAKGEVASTDGDFPEPLRSFSPERLEQHSEMLLRFLDDMGQRLPQ